MTAAILAVGVAVLFVWKRRQERAVNDFSRQIQFLLDEGGTAGRIAPGTEPGALGKLGAAVNKLLEDLQTRGAQLEDREPLFPRPVQSRHDPLLVHRQDIL